MKVFKKLTVVLLSFAMVLTVMPNVISTNAYAASPNDEPVEAIEAIVAESEEAEQKTLKEREDSAKNNTVEVTKGSDKGFILENGKTYVFKQNVKFTNNTVGESAITVPENSTVIFQIEKGVTVTAIGANGYLSKGAGAGIKVPESAKLIIKGEGTLKATGGNATGGENGSNGEDAFFRKEARGGSGNIYAGDGGSGAGGKLYLIERGQAQFYEDSYSVNASKKIELLKTCFKESQSYKLRQDYSKEFKLQETRMIYSSTYNLGLNTDFFSNPWKYELLSGTPKEIAIGLGNDSVNHYLDTYGYQRGQYYGWVYMNFPTQMATSNIVFSNIFDTKKLSTESTEGAIFTSFNIAIFTCGIVALLIPAITIPLVKKRKGKKGKKEEKDEDVKDE